MYVYGIVVTLAATVAALEQNESDSFESLLKNIFGETCSMDDGRVGTCVVSYQCNKNGTTNTDGPGLLQPRLSRGSCSRYLDVCCEHPIPDVTDDTDPIEPQNKGCGWRNPKDFKLNRTTLSSDKAKFGEFPWTVAVLRKEVVGDVKINVYVGGGSIIHPNVVLTVGHKISGLENLFIRAGEWDTQTNSEGYPHQDRMVDEIVIHSEFNPRNLFNDIALMFLTKPLEMAPNVGVVCLPQHNLKPRGGARCFSSGWGKDMLGKKGRFQTIMKKVELPALNNEECQSALRSTRLGRHFQLDSSFMCAGGEANIDTCQGDGGSPLVCPIEFQKDRYMQSGIVAWGIDCGEKGTPGVYTAVSNFRRWVDDNLIKRGYDPAVYTY